MNTYQGSTGAMASGQDKDDHGTELRRAWWRLILSIGNVKRIRASSADSVSDKEQNVDKEDK